MTQKSECVFFVAAFSCVTIAGAFKREYWLSAVALLVVVFWLYLLYAQYQKSKTVKPKEEQAVIKFETKVQPSRRELIDEDKD